MSYHVEVKLVDVDPGSPGPDGPRAMLELSCTTPDGHRLSQSVNLSLDEMAFLSLGLESEEQARTRGEIDGLMNLLSRNDPPSG